MISKTMKLILTGTTGFIGQEVLTQALSHPSITSIVALSRKPLSPTFASNPKLKVVLIDDFSTYTPSVLSQLSGADACIWCIGAKSPDPAITRKVTLEYSLAAASAFSQLAKEADKKFRFIQTSGILAVREGKSILIPFAAEARRIGGETETKLIEFGKEHDELEVYIMRPSGVTGKEKGITRFVAGFLPMIRVDELAAAMVDTAINGGKMQTFENADLAAKGREVLKGAN